MDNMSVLYSLHVCIRTSSFFICFVLCVMYCFAEVRFKIIVA